VSIDAAHITFTFHLWLYSNTCDVWMSLCVH